MNATASTSVLRPVKLPQLPSAWSQVTALHDQLARHKADVEGYRKLETKLENFTDEPTWNAMIPFGPLAFLPGQLVHTNDITQQLPSTKAAQDSSSGNASGAGENGDGLHAGGGQVLLSAKQAREAARRKREVMEVTVRQLEEELERQVALAKRAGYAGLEDGWAVNDMGEVLNEEGLPMFDIQEELPPESQVAEEVPIAVAREPTPAAPKLRYLIKKNGKQIVQPLKAYTHPPPVSPTPEPAAGPAFSPDPDFGTQAILDQLEKEEEEEEARAQADAGASKGSEELSSKAAPVSSTKGNPDSKAPRSTQAGKSARSPTVPSAASLALQTSTKPLPAKDFLPSFSSGFLSRKKPAQNKSLSLSTPAPKTSLAPPKAPVSELAKSISTADPPPREPLHHILPTPKSIYRPTPPSSAPSSRPNSPRLDRRVAFDVPATEEKKPTPKRAAILLPPPPSHEPETSSTSSPAAPPSAKTPFQRPIKETVVERPIRPPQAPRLRETVTKRPDTERAGPQMGTVGKAPKTIAPSTVPTSVAPSATSAPFAGTPIHTLSLSAASPARYVEGQASIHDIVPEADDYYDDDPPEHDPSLTSDGSDSDSSGFYGNEDSDEDDEEVDIDGALQAREIALEYHRQRMNVGAGAGTGPLGGDADATAFDAWNQPNVPVDATLQGRMPGSGRSSRFRTGRLESAQMIIPSLLAQQVREEDGQDSPDEDDGLTTEERENIRKTLEDLAGAQGLGGPSVSAGQRAVALPKAGVDRPAQSISQLLGATATDPSFSSRSAAPPVVKAVGAPIQIPSNPALADPEPAPIAPTKKMSRFKARMLGLEPEA